MVCEVTDFLWRPRTLNWCIWISKNRISLFKVLQALIRRLYILIRIIGTDTSVTF
jgi:hypothetical protein